MTDLAELGAAQYVLLTTFRRDGRAVPTPLWVARDADALVVWTPADAGKVKRLRNRADVTVAPCTFRGEPTGPSVVGTATEKGKDKDGKQFSRSFGWVDTWMERNGKWECIAEAVTLLSKKK